MKRKAILLGVLTLFVAGQASARIMDTWTRISLQFTNLARAQASDTGIGVTTLNDVRRALHLNTISVGSDERPARVRTDGAAGLAQHDPSGDGPDRVERRHRVRAPHQRARRATWRPAAATSACSAPISGAIRSSDDSGWRPRHRARPPAWCASASWRSAAATNLPLDVGKTINGVAQGGGVGGILTIGQLGAIRISILGAPYTVKTVTAFNRTNNGAIDTFTEKGFAHGPLSNTTSTGATSGVLQIVTSTHTDDGWRAGELRHLGSVLADPGALHPGAGAAAPARFGRGRHGAARSQADPQVDRRLERPE